MHARCPLYPKFCQHIRCDAKGKQGIRTPKRPTSRKRLPKHSRTTSQTLSLYTVLPKCVLRLMMRRQSWNSMMILSLSGPCAPPPLMTGR